MYTYPMCALRRRRVSSLGIFSSAYEVIFSVRGRFVHENGAATRSKREVKCSGRNLTHLGAIVYQRQRVCRYLSFAPANRCLCLGLITPLVMPVHLHTHCLHLLPRLSTHSLADLSRPRHCSRSAKSIDSSSLSPGKRNLASPRCLSHSNFLRSWPQRLSICVLFLVCFVLID